MQTHLILLSGKADSLHITYQVNYKLIRSDVQGQAWLLQGTYLSFLLLNNGLTLKAAINN